MVESAMSGGNEFLVKIESYKQLKENDTLYGLSQIKIDYDYTIEHLIPTHKLDERPGGFCTCTELRKPPDTQIYNLNNSDFMTKMSHELRTPLNSIFS